MLRDDPGLARGSPQRLRDDPGLASEAKRTVSLCGAGSLNGGSRLYAMLCYATMSCRVATFAKDPETCDIDISHLPKISNHLCLALAVPKFAIFGIRQRRAPQGVLRRRCALRCDADTQLTPLHMGSPAPRVRWSTHINARHTMTPKHGRCMVT